MFVGASLVSLAIVLRYGILLFGMKEWGWKAWGWELISSILFSDNYQIFLLINWFRLSSIWGEIIYFWYSIFRQFDFLFLINWYHFSCVFRFFSGRDYYFWFQLLDRSMGLECGLHIFSWSKFFVDQFSKNQDSMSVIHFSNEFISHWIVWLSLELSTIFVFANELIFYWSIFKKHWQRIVAWQWKHGDGGLEKREHEV